MTARIAAILALLLAAAKMVIIMRINRLLGRRLVFRNGVSVGFSWVHGNGVATKRSAVIASYHPPDSITWRWALYWDKTPMFVSPKCLVYRAPSGEFGSRCVLLPIIGGVRWAWQRETRRAEARQ